MFRGYSACAKCATQSCAFVRTSPDRTLLRSPGGTGVPPVDFGVSPKSARACNRSIPENPPLCQGAALSVSDLRQRTMVLAGRQNPPARRRCHPPQICASPRRTQGVEVQIASFFEETVSGHHCPVVSPGTQPAQNDKTTVAAGREINWGQAPLNQASASPPQSLRRMYSFILRRS